MYKIYILPGDVPQPRNQGVNNAYKYRIAPPPIKHSIRSKYF